MIFELKHWDDTLIVFDYENTASLGENVKILSINENKKQLLPIGMKKNILSWLKSRVIPKNIQFAPLFDNGLSLFNYATDEDIKQLSKYSKTRFPVLGESFNEVAKTFITERQKKQTTQNDKFSF